MRAMLLVAALAAGCSGSAADDDVTVDGGDGDLDAAPETPDGAVACSAIPDPAPTWLGDYQASFMTAGLLCLIAAGLVIRIGRPAPSSAEPVRAPEPAGATAA